MAKMNKQKQGGRSLCVVSREKFEEWKNGELVFCKDKNSLVSFTEATKNITDGGSADSYYTYEEFFKISELVYSGSFEEERETENGDKIVVFCRYGYND